MALQRTLGLTVPVSEVLNVEAWRRRYAWGVPLAGPSDFTPTQSLKEACTRLNDCACDEQVKSFVAQIPDDVVRWHLRAALSELELKLGVPMGIVVVKTPPLDTGVVLGQHFDRLGRRLPLYQGDANEYWKLSLDFGVISVERVRGYYFGQKLFEVAGSSVIVEAPSSGGLHIDPLTMRAALNNVSRTVAGFDIAYDLWRIREQIPDFWAIDYTLGPRDNMTQTAGQIEVVIAHWVGARAGQMLINQAGTAAAQGIASTSLSMDGITRSVTLSQSAMYGVNSAYELVLKAMTEAIDWRALRDMKRGMPIYQIRGGDA